MRRFYAISAVVLTVGIGGGVVAGCNTDSIGQHKEYVIHMQVDGRTIPCVEIRTDHGASITCDWGANSK